MIFKHCWYRECTKPRCTDPDRHPYYLQVVVNGVKERGPVTKYLHLLDAGTPVPKTIEACKALEALVRPWVARGRPMPAPPIPVVTLPPDARRMVADWLRATAAVLDGEPS